MLAIKNKFYLENKLKNQSWNMTQSAGPRQQKQIAKDRVLSTIQH